MLVDLNKDDLMNLIKGIMPYYSIFDILSTEDLGFHSDKKGLNSWSWNESKLKRMTEVQLFELYQTCLNSYK